MKKIIFYITVIFSISANAADIGTVVILSKQKALLDNSEVVANNIANAETLGFRESRLIENEYSVKNNSGKKIDYANDISTFRNMTTGNLEQTGNPLDLSIAGEGFFSVQTQKGIRYTRVGHFSINRDNLLVTSNGELVLDEGSKEINFPANFKEIEVDEEGLIIIDGEGATKLGIVMFDNANLEQEGNQFFRAKINKFPNANDSTKFKIVQGFLEQSNVNKIKQLTDLVEIQRDASLVSGLLNVYDDLGRNVVGKINY